MFADVLAAVDRIPSLDAVVVVSADPEAVQVARSGGALVLHDPLAAGQSPAAGIGIAHAREHGFERALLLPGDTPLIDPGEVEDLLVRTARDGIAIAIVADRAGTGTNALALAPADAIEPSFGPGSFARHSAVAEASGLPHRAERVASLAHDVDTPEDLEALRAVLAAEPALAPRARAAIDAIDRVRDGTRLVTEGRA